MSWSYEVETLLEKIRANSVTLSNRHRTNFLEYKSLSKYYDLPIIVVSTISASFSVGTQSFIPQEIISTITCGISMFISILGAIKLYLKLDTLIKQENELSKNFNLLHLDIYKTINLSKEQRVEEGLDYLTKKYNDYVRLVEQSNLLRTNIEDVMLIHIDKIHDLDRLNGVSV